MLVGSQGVVFKLSKSEEKAWCIKSMLDKRGGATRRGKTHYRKRAQETRCRDGA